MINWRIYYGNNSVYDNSYGKLQYAPKLNVQCIVVNEYASKTVPGAEEVGRIILHDWDYYLYQDHTGWFGVKNETDLIDHVLHSSHLIKTVLKARSIATADFRKIYSRAWKDPDFPIKSAIRKDEAFLHFGEPD